jgi:hypothetical protein
MIKLALRGLVRQATSLVRPANDLLAQLYPERQASLMSKSTILSVCLSVALGFILALALNRSSAGQPPPPEPVGQEGQVRRYQLSHPSNNYMMVYLTDTVTGRVWTDEINRDDK